MRSAAWMLRIGFVVAVVAAIWMTRPVPGPPGKPIADSGPGGSVTPTIPRPAPDGFSPRKPDSQESGLPPAPSASDEEPLPEATNTAEQSSIQPDDAFEADSAIDPEVRRTLERIATGGPYPYRQDDTVFVNREGRLPKQSLGYYREFTVKTPGADDRGPRRIVRGKRGELYFTEDHYRTFVRIDDRPGSGPPRRDRQPSRGPNTSPSERSR